MSVRKIKFGVLGTSRVAVKGVIPAMRDSELAELHMIGGRVSNNNVAELASQFNCPQWGSYEDLIANKEIDAIYISLPNFLHEEWTIKALDAGKHVYCEKPAAFSYASAKRMVEKASKSGKRLIEGLMFRYHPQHTKVRQLISEGAIGEVLRFDSCFGYQVPQIGTSAMRKESGGGSLYACGVYPIAASRMIFEDEPTKIFAKFTIDQESGVDVGAHIVLEYSGEKVAFVSSFFGSYYQSTYSVLGTKGYVRVGRAYAVPRDTQTKIFFDSNDTIEEIVVQPTDHFRLLIDDFVTEIRKGSESTKRYESDLLNQSRVVEAAQRSHAEGRVVSFQEIL